MPLGRNTITAHWRDLHSTDEILELTRDSNGDIFVKEKTSGEVVLAMRRTGANAYTLYNNTVAGGKVLQDSSMKNIANGIAGLNAAAELSALDYMTQSYLAIAIGVG